MGSKVVRFTGGLLSHQVTGRVLRFPLGWGLHEAVQATDPRMALLSSR